MLEWTLEYFYNGYRAGAENIITTVLATFGGQSYYGWVPAALETSVSPPVQTEAKPETEEPESSLLMTDFDIPTEDFNYKCKCKRASVVSIKRPTDRHLHIRPSNATITLTITTNRDSTNTTITESVTSTIDTSASPSTVGRVLGNSIESHFDQTLNVAKQVESTPREYESLRPLNGESAVILIRREEAEEPSKKRPRLEYQATQAQDITVQITPQTTIKPVGINNIPVIRSHLLLKKKH
jgi:hypothetical protein